MSNLSNVDINGEKILIKDTYARDQLKHLNVDNYTADVTGDYTVNAGNIAMSSENATMHTTADRTIDTDGNDSVHIDGASTLNVGGLRTETFAGDKTETVTGTCTEKAGTRSTTVTGKWSVNLPGKAFDMKDVALENNVTSEISTAVNAEAKTRADADAAINARIDNAKQYTHFVVIGDSFSNDAQTGTPLWYTYIERQTELTAYTNSSDGTGYTTGGDNDFIHQIQKAAAALDVAKVKTVYILGGLNDLGNTSATTETFTNKFNETINTASNLFPHSEIVVAGIAPFQNYNFYSGKTTLNAVRTRDFKNIMRFYSGVHGAKFIDLSFMGLFTAEYFGAANSGNQKHPSKAGSAIIASSILSGHSMAQGTLGIMPEMKPFADNGTIEVQSESIDANNVTILVRLTPTAETVTINWNGLPYPVGYLPLSIVGGTTIVGYTSTDPSIMTFNNATINNTYYGCYTISV